MTQESWLSTHPYLRPVAALHAQVEAAAADACTSISPAVRLETYLEDFLAGVPLLRNPEVPFDFAAAEKAIRSLVERLASTTLPEKLTKQLQVLQTELQSSPENSASVIQWLIDKDLCHRSCAGLLRYLAWISLSRYLSVSVKAFETWSERERWLRPYCPICGSLPAMAQLVGSDPARTRFLSCGCCYTRWPYRRLGCPFCQNQDDRRLGVLMVETEGGLRIDYCELCKGYLKTYCGQGNEGVLLADWTSMHLDIAAREKGLNRLAASLYEV